MNIKEEREDKAIDVFIERLSIINDVKMVVLDRPDRNPLAKGGCDALIEENKSKIALDHTTVDIFPNQRADDPAFLKVMVPIEGRVLKEFPDSDIRITVPTFVIPKGDQDAFRVFLENEIISAIKTLSFGNAEHEFNFPNIPFPVWIIRQKNDHPLCYVGRKAKIGLSEVITKIIEDKYLQLTSYKRSGYKTVLLMDSDDFTIINADMIREEFVQVARSKADKTTAFDEVYLITTYATANPWLYPIKIGNDMYPNLPQEDSFLHVQNKLLYGKY